MAAHAGTMTRPDLLALGEDSAETPFDYVVVGSGAGGGTVAARLALNGRRVLLLESGPDAALDVSDRLREVYAVPAFHARASEDRAMSWEFSVRHYADTARQEDDPCYDRDKDPSSAGRPGRGGILYPRCATLGGCTAHHAMIVMRTDDSDWNRIARLTGDESWRAENMQGYFAKIERCLYYALYRGFAGRQLGGLVRALQYAVTLINPRSQLDPSGHGLHGWQPTSFIDPLVVTRILRGDPVFLRIFLGVARWAFSKGEERGLLLRALRALQLIQLLDPNVRSPAMPDWPGLSLVPIGTDGLNRSGLREHVLDVARAHPDRLVIVPDSHATRILFAAPAAKGDAPRAIGVEVAPGRHLYRASPLAQAAPGLRRRYYARSETIICGGAFNTPQLLMLSGIGDAEHLAALGIEGPRDTGGIEVAPVVNLAGVGRNLHDRYEISVVSQANAPFKALDKVSFRPGEPDDPARAAWLDGKTGLYSTNGGALALMLRSRAARLAQSPPDLYLFGIPAAFRGYYWGWPDDLLRAARGAPGEQRDLWTWVILQAYARNRDGSVRLLSANPFDTPQIDFHSFVEGTPGYQHDVAVLADALAQVRQLNACVTPFVREIFPGDGIAASAQVEEWIQQHAWGHHACGSCRIGSDKWQKDAGMLQDRGAVLDSEFRVHGVEGLRVVDASAFPDIPGYFIVAPTFMIAEKAADAILADAPEYPSRIEQAEAAAIHARRLAIGRHQTPLPPASLPEDTIGLALSGGGIRSAIFTLGVLQALASVKKLRRIDVMSTTSGGGYTGSFIGRMYTRLAHDEPDKAGRIEEALSRPDTPQLWWLRQHAHYLAGGGRSDALSSVASILRNLVSVYFCLGALLLAAFGLLRWAADLRLHIDPGVTGAGLVLSPWWPVVPYVAAFVTLPYVLAFWLSPPMRPRAEYAVVPLALWMTLAIIVAFAAGTRGPAHWAVAAAVVLLVAWFLQEAARFRLSAGAGADMGAAYDAVRVRNRLNRGMGASLVLLAALCAFVAIDSLARLVASHGTLPAAWSMAAASVALAALRWLVATHAGLSQRLMRVLPMVSFTLLAALLVLADAVANAAFVEGRSFGRWAVLGALALSLVLGRGFRFLNSSSLHAFYTERLVRTFLGASNPLRTNPVGAGAPVRIDVPDEGDDIWHRDYHPENRGGPLHLINVCVNSTVDAFSGRQLPQDRGLAMCVGPAGISVGRRFHAAWEGGSPQFWPKARAVPVAPDPNAFHVLARRDGQAAGVEPLRLGQWMAISGASFSTGAGRATSLVRSLFFGALNVRLGYWWNSGIDAGARPGRFPPGLWRRLKALPALLFHMQATLLDEWRGYFPGPSQRFWYLSDGGHFDNTALYEMLRRRLPFVIAIDGGQDPDYLLEDLSILTRAARIDFGADFRWVDPRIARQSGLAGWRAIEKAAGEELPASVKAMVDADSVFELGALQRASHGGAALARIDYRDERARNVTWLLMVKGSAGGDLPVDVRNYAAVHADFPNESTLNQFFSDSQWESYRMLGYWLGRKLF